MRQPALHSAMEVIKGTAAGVRNTVHVSGDKNGISTRHHTIFKVGATTVIFTSGAPAIISDGDQLTVAGKRKGSRVLLCDAYLNRSLGVRGDAGLWTNFIGMIFGCLLAAVGLGWGLLGPFFPALPNLDTELKWFVTAGGAILCGLALYCLYRWVRIREAVKLVRSDSRTLPPASPFGRT